MSEADWWLCGRCNSLNNLAARKCYSCQERKPKDAAYASEVLEYVPEISWDGKVKFHGKPPKDPDPDDEEALRGPRPIREPVRRTVLAVAPRLPHPASITYQPGEPPPRPSPHGSPLRPMTTPEPAPAVAPVPPPPAPGPAPAKTPVPPPATPGPSPAMAAGPPQDGPGPPAWLIEPPLTPEPPVVAVGPGQEPAAMDEPQTWPHWRELLDGPRPDADRLRSSPAAEADPDVKARAPEESRGGLALNDAIREARLTRAAESRAFIPWPSADLPVDGPDGSAEGGLPVETDEGQPTT